MYKYLECTPESLTEEHIHDLRVNQNDGLYPPRFELFFQSRSRRAVPLPVMITLNGLVDGSVPKPKPKPYSNTVILGMPLNLFTRRCVIVSLSPSYTGSADHQQSDNNIGCDLTE